MTDLRTITLARPAPGSAQLLGLLIDDDRFGLIQEAEERGGA